MVSTRYILVYSMDGSSCMNILFLTIAYNGASRNIYSDLMYKFKMCGHCIWVVCQEERRSRRYTRLCLNDGINILYVKTWNLTGKVSLIEKGVATLSIEYLFKNAINKYLYNIKFDLVLYSTPPITFSNVVKYIRNKDGAKTYLLLKDIFPQNAVDLGLIKESGFIYRYFRHKEEQLYQISDHIGCMSEANIQYVLAHNDLSKEKVELNPNCIKPLPVQEKDEQSIKMIRAKYGIPGNAIVFAYGGNLGIPQGLEFLVEVCKKMNNRQDIFLLIVGDGGRYDYLAGELNTIDANNIKLMKKIPKEDYDKLITACDVGLIFLNLKFTIPNFPSRLTSYMEMCLPVLAATDTATDLKDVLAEAGCGLWAKSGDVDTFLGHMDFLAKHTEERQAMGKRGRKYLEEHYTVDKSYEIIMRHFENNGGTANVRA